MMTKQDYKLIAKALKETSHLYETSDNYDLAINVFISEFTADNPRFNEEAFRKATTVQI